MANRYVPLRAPRFELIQTGADEIIQIKARKQIFTMLFLPFWLTGWTVGGGFAIWQFLQTGEPFLAFWLCGWAAGWVAAAGTLIWMAAGREHVFVENGDLTIEQTAFGFRRRWMFNGRDVGPLQIAVQPFFFANANGLTIPFTRLARNGAIKFAYGARTEHFAAGLDEAEAVMVIERLDRRLGQPVGRA